MNEQNIEKLIHTIKSLGIVDSPDVFIPMPMQCKVPPPQHIIGDKNIDRKEN